MYFFNILFLYNFGQEENEVIFFLYNKEFLKKLFSFKRLQSLNVISRKKAARSHNKPSGFIEKSATQLLHVCLQRYLNWEPDTSRSLVIYLGRVIITKTLEPVFW